MSVRNRFHRKFTVLYKAMPQIIIKIHKKYVKKSRIKMTIVLMKIEDITIGQWVKVKYEGEYFLGKVLKKR